ncbi:hypothetical protein GOQ30_02885 [Flavobacterium sp. TP390]|uniref:Gliding motility-associated protein GldM N-terminal domain-containing protein n=1 Tax=Flavobacterium profundi TaxID=1774945 RepID=A0A6I4IEX9_9FLAO|nr:hypothetical protein [Flavobacterium profundi]MVO08108.1 hypothetical protein [Flavobacterium profundi]
MKKLFLALPFLLISCNSEMNLEKIYETTYELHIAENNTYNKSLLDNIKLKLVKLKNANAFNKIKDCDSLSKHYFEYLETIENQMKQNGSELFFDGDVYSKTGKTYEEKTEKYISEIGKLTNSKNFIQRLNLVFSMKDIKSKDGIFIRYLDYYFRGFPKIQSVTFINDKKRNVLEFENELINEIIISNIE